MCKTNKQTNKQTEISYKQAAGTQEITPQLKKQPLPFIQLKALKIFILHKDFVHVSEVLL